jgi:hypothetical protein
MASVPTGTPAGIWTIERRLSRPESALLRTGTPSTGNGVKEAIIREGGRHRRAPARSPGTGSRAVRAKVKSRSGVRWAETIRAACGMPRSSSTVAASRKVGQSDWLPMTMATGGACVAGCMLAGCLHPRRARPAAARGLAFAVAVPAMPRRPRRRRCRRLVLGLDLEEDLLAQHRRLRGKVKPSFTDLP